MLRAHFIPVRAGRSRQPWSTSLPLRSAHQLGRWDRGRGARGPHRLCCSSLPLRARPYPGRARGDGRARSSPQHRAPARAGPPLERPAGSEAASLPQGRTLHPAERTSPREHFSELDLIEEPIDGLSAPDPTRRPGPRTTGWPRSCTDRLHPPAPAQPLIEAHPAELPKPNPTPVKLDVLIRQTRMMSTAASGPAAAPARPGTESTPRATCGTRSGRLVRAALPSTRDGPATGHESSGD